MVKGREVQAALYEFMLFAFGGDFGDKPPPSPSPERMSEVMALLLAHNSLRAESVAQWPEETRGAAWHILSGLLIVVSLFEDLTYPAGFLAGTTQRRLGEPVIAYIHRYQHQLLTLGQGNGAP